MSGITFGTPAAANPSTSFTLGGGFGNTSSSGGGFSFGKFGSSAGTANTTTTTSLGAGFSFGGASQTTTTSTAAAPLSFGGSALTTSGTSGLFGNQSTLTATSSINAGGVGLKPTTQTTASTPLWGGLGGSDGKSPIKSGLGNKTNEVKGVKDNVVPPEILATVEEFSKHVKAQKLVRESIARMTSRPLFKVEDDLKELRQRLHEVATMLQTNSVGVEKLKKEATNELKHVEIAQRTKETPPGLQYENVQPAEYFQRLVEDFERQMALYRQQFFDAEKFFASINHSTASKPSELLAVFTKLNEGFVSLAAKLQVVHESVKNLKENYAQFRKRHICDGNSDIFRKTQNGRQGSAASAVARDFTTFGPSPFSYGSSISSVAFSSAVDRSSTLTTANQSQQNVMSQVGPFARRQQFQQQQRSAFFPDSATTSSVGFGTAVHSSAPSTSVAIGTPLQRPGNKRGKNA